MEAKELFRTNLIRIRKEQGLTQRALASKAGITCKHMSRIERGNAYPSWEVMQMLVDALGVPVSSLFRDICGEMDKEEVRAILEKVIHGVKDGMEELAGKVLDGILPDKED